MISGTLKEAPLFLSVGDLDKQTPYSVGHFNVVETKSGRKVKISLVDDNIEGREALVHLPKRVLHLVLCGAPEISSFNKKCWSNKQGLPLFAKPCPWLRCRFAALYRVKTTFIVG